MNACYYCTQLFLQYINIHMYVFRCNKYIHYIFSQSPRTQEPRLFSCSCYREENRENRTDQSLTVDDGWLSEREGESGIKTVEDCSSKVFNFLDTSVTVSRSVCTHIHTTHKVDIPKFLVMHCKKKHCTEARRKSNSGRQINENNQWRYYF